MPDPLNVSPWCGGDDEGGDGGDEDDSDDDDDGDNGEDGDNNDVGISSAKNVSPNNFFILFLSIWKLFDAFLFTFSFIKLYQSQCLLCFIKNLLS